MRLNRSLPYRGALAVFLGVLFLMLSSPVRAQRAVLLVDINDGAVLHAENALRPSYPASLTKLMTLYLLFEAVQSGRYSHASALPISALAAAQLPVNLGLRAGRKISVEDAINAIIVMSANDVAVVVAEAVGDSHEQFVEMMNAKAKTLGMTNSTFRNASGLPDPQQVTTARDMAILARALFDFYPNDYKRFATLAFDFNGRHVDTHNNFLRSFEGAEGLKTGFTCKAGFNLVAAATLEEKHLIGVILGETTAGARDARMARVMKLGFSGSEESIFNLDNFPESSEQGGQDSVNQQIIAKECINPQGGRRYFAVKDWSVEFGVEVRRQAAVDRARSFIKEHRGLLKGGRPLLIPRMARRVIYRVGVTGLAKANAINTCLSIRSKTIYCVVRSPKAASYAMKKALRVLAAIAKRDKQKND